MSIAMEERKVNKIHNQGNIKRNFLTARKAFGSGFEGLLCRNPKNIGRSPVRRQMGLMIEQNKKAMAAGCDETRPMGDKHYRSLAKAISWRMTGTLDTVVISFLITGRIRWALSIGFVELFTKVALYYLHERLWNKISFGRKPLQGDYQI